MSYEVSEVNSMASSGEQEHPRVCLHLADDWKKTLRRHFVDSVRQKHPSDLSLNGYPVHKFILCAKSEYFRKMLTGKFAENNSKQITIDWIADELMQHVVDYLYCEPMKVPSTALAALFKVADYFMMDGLMLLIKEALNQAVTNMNYFDVLSTFKVLGDDASKLCSADIMRKFHSAMRRPENQGRICELPFPVVLALAKSDNVGTHKERQVLEPILKWLQKGNNKEKEEQLLMHIRWNKVDDLYLCFLATQNSSKVKKGSALLRYVHEGMEYKLLKKDQGTPASAFYKYKWPTARVSTYETVKTHSTCFFESASDNEAY